MTDERKKQAKEEFTAIVQSVYEYRKKYGADAVSIYSCNLSEGNEWQLDAWGTSYNPDIEVHLWTENTL